MKKPAPRSRIFYNEVEPLFGESLAVTSEAFGNDPLEVAAVLNQLGIFGKHDGNFGVSTFGRDSRLSRWSDHIRSETSREKGDEMMITKKNSTSEQEAKRAKVTVGKLKVNQEPSEDLSPSEKKQIKGGVGALKRKADPDEGGE